MRETATAGITTALSSAMENCFATNRSDQGVRCMKTDMSLKYENRENTASEAEKETKVIEQTDAHAVYAPVSGKTVSMEEIPDPTFSQGILGWTMGIEPSDGAVRALFEGKVVQAADTGHAVGLVSRDGMELLIHVGVDTVDMGGTGFDMKVKEGEEVKAGQLLLTFDRKAVADAGHSDVAVVIVLNPDDYTSVGRTAEGAVVSGEKIIQASK